MLDNKSEQERIGKDKIPQALEALRSLDAKELPDVPARVAIRQMRRQIERVLRLGYTYDEVSEVLAGLDIHISGNRIKYLLSEVRKETRSRKKKADSSEVGGSVGAGTSLGASSESHSATLHGAEHNGSRKQSPQSEPQSQPQLQSKQQSQTQPQPQSKRQSQTQPQSETQEQSSTVDVDSLTDDYEPMTLRRR